jgi:hypothetical protein
MVSESILPWATPMLIGSAGARSPLSNAGVALTTATGGAGVVELVAGEMLVGFAEAGLVVVAAVVSEPSGVLVPAAAVRPPGDPVVQPAVTASNAAASEPTIKRR